MLATFGSGQVLLSMMWFFLFVIWMMLLFRVFGDIMVSKDMGGGKKVIWSLFVILMPFLGIFIYVIVRGKSMEANQAAAMQARNDSAQQYIKSVAGSPSTADELERLASLRDAGTITAAEFDQLKAKTLA